MPPDLAEGLRPLVQARLAELAAAPARPGPTGQVATTADLADLPAASAVLQGSAVQAIRDISPDLLELVIGLLLTRLSE